ncbi:MAG: HAD hydrolase-like protein [Novosphingobium sp.]|nr:HAD hydrolase-like protein [Novosphingobium sp.]MCP5402930.1 HAD hydrolase-like protein [Novosphingobium sp.]
MNSLPFDIVGFDLDGTLLDTHGDLGAAVNHALGIAGRPEVPVGEVRGLIGGGGKLMLQRALDLTGGIPEAEFPELLNALLRFYEDNIAVHTQPFAGCEAMLDGLASRGARLAVVTNKRESLAAKVMAELGLTSRFYTIIGGDTLGPGRAKPARDQLDEMIGRAGGGRAAYVGDTTFDTRAATAAGLPCVAVSFGFNDLPPDELGAAAVIDHFDELIPTLQRLGSSTIA